MKKLSVLVTVLLLFLQSGVSAQDLETGYFLGGNPYAFRMNPAFQSERNIFSLALGQTGLGTWSNLGFSTLLYSDVSDGHLYTFLNDRVNAAEFLRKIKSRNTFDEDARVNLLTLGFWAGDRFYTLDFNVRSLNSLAVPYDVFSFLKEGGETRNQYDFSGLGLRSQTFAEAAFGWSKNFDDVFNIGFRVKALLGALEVNTLARNMKLAMSNDRWEVQAQSYLYASSPSLTYSLDESGNPDPASIKLNGNDWGPAGFGGAVDLGASWNVLPYLTLSASLLDIGAIRWNREIQFVSPASSYTWAPSESGESGSEDWSAEFDEALNGLSGVFRFNKNAAVTGAAFEMLPFQIYLGAEFRMPFYDRLSLGALYSGRTGSGYGRQTGRISLNWNPLDFLSLSTGTTLNRLGQSIGFALNLHPGGVNLMVGCDYLPFYCVSMAPLLKDAAVPSFIRQHAVLPRDQMKLNLYVGLNLAFGRTCLDYARRYWYR
jgi:hypothetical protein